MSENSDRAGTLLRPPPNRDEPDWQERAALMPAAAVILWAAVTLRLPAMGPRSLWLDDAWVAFLVKYAGLGDLGTYAASVPMGFVAILKPFQWLIQDPEISLQVFPFLAGIACVVAIGFTVVRLTASPSIGLLASACLAINPFLVTYSARVKQYTSDCLAVILLMAWGLPQIADAGPARLARFAAGSFFALVVSYVSIFVSAPLLHLPVLGATWDCIRRRRSLPLRALAVVAAFDVCAGGFYWVRLRYQTRPALKAFWGKAFVPTDSLDSVYAFFERQGSRAIEGAVPIGVELLVPLMVLGFAWLLAQPERRLQALFFPAFFVGLLAASLLHSYPIGGGRTDMFYYPVTLSLACVGVAVVVRGVTWFAPAIKPIVAATVLVAAVVVAVHSDRHATYPAVDNASLVRILTRITKRYDAVVIHWNALSTLGYYSKWQFDPDFSRSRIHKFRALPARKNTIVAGRGVSPFPVEFLKNKRRAVYFETHIFPRVRERRSAIYDTFAAAGFEPVRTIERMWARIVVYAPLKRESNDGTSDGSGDV